MSNKNLGILAVVAVVMVVLAMVTARVNRTAEPQLSGPAYLIQGLDPEDIGIIEIVKKDDTLTLRRAGDGFVVSDKDNFPAKTKEINELITKALEIKIGELISQNKEAHSDLGVSQDKAEYIIKFLKSDSTVLTGVVVGENAEKGGVYVRQLKSDKVYIAEERPWFKTYAVNYIDMNLIKVQSEKISSATVQGPNDVYTLFKDPNSGEIELEGIASDKKLIKQAAEEVLKALTDLTFYDVMQKAGNLSKFNFSHTYICILGNSTVYTVRIAEKDDKYHVTCSAEFTDQTPVQKARTIESEEELKKKEAKLIARDQANQFNERFSDWIFEIPKYKAEKLIKPLSELVEKKSEETADPNDN